MIIRIITTNNNHTFHLSFKNLIKKDGKRKRNLYRSIKEDKTQ